MLACRYVFILQLSSFYSSHPRRDWSDFNWFISVNSNVSSPLCYRSLVSLGLLAGSHHSRVFNLISICHFGRRFCPVSQKTSFSFHRLLDAGGTAALTPKTNGSEHRLLSDWSSYEEVDDPILGSLSPSPLAIGSLAVPLPDWLTRCVLFISQLDNVDEQAAQIRRELDGRLQLAEKISRVRAATGKYETVFNLLWCAL